MEPVQLITQDSKLVKQAEELKERQRQQQAAARGEKGAVKEIQANRDKAFKVRDFEKDMIHVLVIQRSVNPDLKSISEEKRVLKIHQRNFQQMIDAGAFAAFDEARIIHDPRKDAGETDLKPFNPENAPLSKDDAAIAAREQKLRDKEREQEEKAKELDAKIKRLEELAARMEGNQATNLGVKSGSGAQSQVKAQPKAETQPKTKKDDGDELPPLP